MNRQDLKRELAFFPVLPGQFGYMISHSKKPHLLVSLQCHKCNTIPTTITNVSQNSISLDFDRQQRIESQASKIFVIWPQLYEENRPPLQSNSRIFATDLNINGYIIISVKVTTITKISQTKKSSLFELFTIWLLVMAVVQNSSNILYSAQYAFIETLV